MEFNIDEYGRVSARGIHDAVLTALSYRLDDRLDLSLEKEGSSELSVKFSGLKKVGFKNLVEGAIVSDIYCAPLSSGQEYSWQEGAWRTLFGGNYLEKDFDSIRLKLGVRYSSCSLLLVETSYGGQISAIGDTLGLKRQK
jgi:hypothetical protein